MATVLRVFGLQWELANVDSLPGGYQGYRMFGLLVVAWVAKGFLLNLGGPGQMFDFQMFLSVPRSPRCRQSGCRLECIPGRPLGDGDGDCPAGNFGGH